MHSRVKLIHSNNHFTLVDLQTKLVSEFQSFDDWLDKYIIDLGKTLEPLAEDKRKDKYLIKGCQSLVWLYADFQKGKMKYYADSNTTITKGLIAILIKVFTNKTPQEVLNTDISFINQLGLKEHLSPTRANGLVSMVNQIRAEAQFHLK